TCGRFSPRKWISSLAWRNAAIPFRLNFSASCTLIIHPQHACILQAHLVLETDPSFRLILYWKRLNVDLVPDLVHHYSMEVNVHEAKTHLFEAASASCIGRRGDYRQSRQAGRTPS